MKGSYCKKHIFGHLKILIPVNKNRNCDLEIPGPVEKTISCWTIIWWTGNGIEGDFKEELGAVKVPIVGWPMLSNRLILLSRHNLGNIWYICLPPPYPPINLWLFGAKLLGLNGGPKTCKTFVIDFQNLLSLYFYLSVLGVLYLFTFKRKCTIFFCSFLNVNVFFPEICYSRSSVLFIFFENSIVCVVLGAVVHVFSPTWD